MLGFEKEKKGKGEKNHNPQFAVLGKGQAYALSDFRNEDEC